jgi:hypothetical protein
LFLIYIDDIIKDIETNIFLFADDTSLFDHILDPVMSFAKMNRDLVRLQNWSTQWLVSFNPTKTQYIVFSKKLVKPAYPDLYLDGKKLTIAKQHKQLGITLNARMTFDDHIRENCKKAMNRITALKRLRNRLPRKSKLDIYTSFIRPVLEFGWQLYDGASKQALSMLEKVQREALLLVTSAYKKTSHTKLLNEVGIPLLSRRREMQKIQFMHKYARGKVPKYLCDIIPPTVGKKVGYNLRNVENIVLPRTKKTYFLKSFIPSSIKVWNALDIKIRESSSKESMKAKLKAMYGNQSYSLFLYGDSSGAINHSRIRMGLSGLNAQRKKCNFIPNGSCGTCGYKSETPQHYFLFCPTYAAQRQQLLRELTQNVTDIMQPLANFQNSTKSSNDFIQLLLTGTGNREYDTIVFKNVHNYITSTNRFN